MSATPPPDKSASAALSQEEQWRRNYRRKRRFKVIGLTLAIIGATIVFIHWLAHLEAFGPEQPAPLLDLLAGYPMGGLLLLAAGIVAGQK